MSQTSWTALTTRLLLPWIAVSVLLVPLQQISVNSSSTAWCIHWLIILTPNRNRLYSTIKITLDIHFTAQATIPMHWASRLAKKTHLQPRLIPHPHPPPLRLPTLLPLLLPPRPALLQRLPRLLLWCDHLARAQQTCLAIITKTSTAQQHSITIPAASTLIISINYITPPTMAILLRINHWTCRRMHLVPKFNWTRKMCWCYRIKHCYTQRITHHKLSSFFCFHWIFRKQRLLSLQGQTFLQISMESKHNTTLHTHRLLIYIYALSHFAYGKM